MRRSGGESQLKLGGIGSTLRQLPKIKVTILQSKQCTSSNSDSLLAEARSGLSDIVARGCAPHHTHPPNALPHNTPAPNATLDTHPPGDGVA